MKKRIKMIFLLMMFLPFIVNASSTINEGKTKANNYITSFENYKKYILFPTDSSKYAYEESGYNSVNGNGFLKGGFISATEYRISIHDGSSWLSPGIGYWTLTKGNNNEYYYISNSLSTKNMNEQLSVRVTEYVQPSTVIKGKGTTTNPWYFVEAFTVRLKSNNENYGNLLSNENTGEQILFVERNSTKSVNYTLTSGYDISKSNLTDCDTKYFNVDNNKLTIKSVDRDLSCTINFEPKKYTVTLNAMEGILSTKALSVTYSQKYGEIPTPTKEGFVFEGWFTSSTGGTKVTNETIVTETKDHTLYAQWKANIYTVTFNGNNGTMGSTTTKNVSYDGTYGDLSGITATRTGYTFAGWYTAASGGTQVTSTTKVTQTKDHTLYAHWTANKYTVTFAKNDGTSNNAGTRTVTFASAYGTLPTTTRTGYTFTGWFTAAIGGTQVTSTTKVTQAKDHTLYAHWTANKYTVTFAKNDGTSNNAGTRTVTYASIYGILPTATRTGYTFIGWFTAASGGTQVTSTTKVTITSNQTLYAHWKSDKITCSNLTYKCSNTSKGSDYKLTYNGKCEVTCENENWKVKFLTSGTLTTTVSLNIDVFLVGGGGGGYTTSYSVGGAGGGGYTKTVKNITLQPNTYKIDIGVGGGGGQNGKSSTVKLNNAIINDLSAEGGKTGTLAGGCCGYCSWGGAGGNYGGGWSDCNEGTPMYPSTFGGGQGSTTCEFGEGTTTKCNAGVKQYSGGGCCGCCYTPTAGGGACSGGSGQANTGGGGGAYYLNVGSGGSGIVIFRDKR